MALSIRAFSLWSFASVTVGWAAACSAPPTTSSDGSGGSSTDGPTLATGGVSLGSGGSGVSGVPPELVNQPATASCADGILDDDEACDDGNPDSGDGCGSNCRYVELGFVCPDAGELCRPFAKCGDGKITFPEQCDDGAGDAGDGCSASCKYEVDYTCDGAPSSCRRTTCGDANQEGAETCEGADGLPFDGCSLTCQAEPRCTDSGCTSQCGDGLIILPEECDDGNGNSGDGCSADCKQEPGYVCTQAPACTGGDCSLELPIIYRDFTAAHSDFGVDCAAQILGIPSERLNVAGKPELNSGTGACIESATSFAEWYAGAEIVSSIVLYETADGGYVNRYGADGTGWPRMTAENQTSSARCTDAGCCTTLGLEDEPWNCCEANDTDCRPCSYNSAAGCDQTLEYQDGNPLFFPLDDNLTDTAGSSAAKIPQEVYGGSWKWEDASCPDDACPGPLHNFHFTSEIAYWFKYEAGMTANLTFVGDDDVWVFVNRRLAVDLGGLHVPVEGSLTLAADGGINLVSGVNGATDGSTAPSTSSASAFGLEDGGVYEIKVFQAERKATGSSYKLTLSGFNTARSECTPFCGDGIIAAGEQCDDGTENNVGGQNRCNADCTIGEYCGDGIVQSEFETCDDGDPDRPADCAGCRILVVK